MKKNEKINYRLPPNSPDFEIIFGYFWNHGVGNFFDKDGDPTPWTPETLELACETAGKPVDRRTIQNWRSGKNKPGRRNMHVLAKVASGGEDRQRQVWADRFIATLDTPAMASVQKPAPSPENVQAAKAPLSNPSDRAKLKWPGLLLCAVAAVFAAGVFKSSLTPSPKPEVMRVAVMPFETLSESPGEAYISTGITDDIIQSLTQLPDLYITPRRNSRAVNRSQLSIEDIGEALNVGFLLEGTMRIDAGRMKLNTNLINIESGEHVWSGQFDDQTDNLFSIQESVADGVTDALDIILSPDRRSQMFDFGTENVEAYRQYLKGRHLMKFWHETHEGDDIWLAGEALEAAVAADPTMGRAWVHMTDLFHHYAADHIGPPVDPLNVTVPKTQAATMSHLKTLLANGEKHGDETTALQAKANRIFFSEDWTGLREAVLNYAELVTSQRGELEWLYVPILLTLLGETEAQKDLMDKRVLRYDPGNGTGHAYVIRQYLTSGQLSLAEKRLSEAEASSFSSRLAEVKGYMLAAQRNGEALRAHIDSSKARLSPMLLEYFDILALHFDGYDAGAQKLLAESSALKRERIHLALAHHHIGETAIAKHMFDEIANEPIGIIQIAVQLSYGAACGPYALPPIPPLDARMAQAEMVQLPCIGRATPPRDSESLQK